MAPIFGLTLPQRGVLFGVTTYPAMLDLAAEADECELFGSLWVGDSLTSKPRPEALSLLGALAARTRRLRLGVGCMASFPVRDPRLFAYQWASLDQLSGGRMQLAVCTGLVAGGASAREGALWGVKDSQRASRMEENIEICRRLWTEDGVTFAGRFTSFENATLEIKPVQRPCPIWIAANPPSGRFFAKSVERVATMADGWMTSNVFPGMLGAYWRRLEQRLREHGKDAAAFPTIEYHNINIGADREACLAESKRFLDQYYGPIFPPQMVEAWTAAGTPDQCVAHLDRLLADGAKQITLRITAWDQRGQYRRMVEEVLPRVGKVREPAAGR
jgi:alkanesulfonate monooxygenase SsuD/methylene tetrahydromethanopterin reductase-like flavin-dependent oxidoreductase (luciferase family)